MKNTLSLDQTPPTENVKLAGVRIYPAIADSIDLPRLSFLKKRNEAFFTLQATAEQRLFLRKNPFIIATVKTLEDQRLKMLLAPILSECTDSAISINITGRRSSLLKITGDGANISIEAHWNLFIPYFNHIKSLPIVHPDILDIFTRATATYVALAMKQPGTPKNRLNNQVIDAYKTLPELLLASLDVFNKPNIYHIRPTRIWLNMISAANDRYRLEIDASAAVAAPIVRPDFLDKFTCFIHKIVKNYAFRYGDYLWTQKYKIILSDRPGADITACEEKEIVINILPVLHQVNWKPTVYLGLGYAIMLAMLQSSRRGDKEKCVYLALMKTWNRYLSFDESGEQQSVRELCGFSKSTTEQQCRSLSKHMIGKESKEYVDNFLVLANYPVKETPAQGVVNDRYRGKTGLDFEQLSGAIQSLNTTLMKNNINHGKLIEMLRSDNFDHLQLAEFLRTGHLENRWVVDVSEWLLLRTLLYDLINAPKVFKNDYKMLLRVLTKVNKSLLVYIWTLGLQKDGRYEIVSTYIAKVMHDIFVFDRVKIYEIVSDPVECLEAEAVTGYLLNWAGFKPGARRSILEGALSSLPSNVIAQLEVQTTADVDRMISIMGTRASGLIGFHLHQAYRWGTTNDELTEGIRSYFPELLKQAQMAMLPTETARGGAMLLLLLAQIVSDEHDGFAENIVVTEKERQTVRGLIKQCVDWDQKHFVMMIAGMAAGYMGNIDGWVLQQFDRLLARYDGGDRIMLRSVVQFDVDKLIERALTTAREGEESTLLNKIRLFRFGVDPVISDEANRFLRELSSRCGIESPEVNLKKKDISELVLAISGRMKKQVPQT